MRFFAFALTGAAIVIGFGLQSADCTELSRVTVLEENDSMPFKSDKHYTQGLKISYLSPSITPNGFWQKPFALLNLVESETRIDRRYTLEFGQSFFTPKNYFLDPPDSKDRPYAGWLYAGLGLLQNSSNRHLDHLGLELGVVGPAALAKQTQDGYHQIFNFQKFDGWGHQLHNEPGIIFDYERSWRLWLSGDTFLGQGIDIVPEAGITFGNVFDYAEAGMLLRIGRDLNVDYGPPRIKPALSGNNYYDGSLGNDPWGGYFFLGLQGRGIGRNIFLDGNSFQHSASIQKKVWVGDLEGGFSLFDTTGLRIDVTGMRRSIEYQGQRAPDVLGVLALSLAW